MKIEFEIYQLIHSGSLNGYIMKFIIVKSTLEEAENYLESICDFNKTYTIIKTYK